MPSLASIDALQAIRHHSDGFADAAASTDLGVAAEHCPGWSMADLVWHLTEVHWVWATIVDRRLQEPPPEGERPSRGASDQLIPQFRLGATHLVDVLAAADPADRVWTWAATQHDAAFVLRHQVQEAAVHHWDAAHAAGLGWDIDAAVAVDSIEEFLTFSVSTEADPAEPQRPDLDGTLVMRCSDVDRAWRLTDGRLPGSVAVSAVPAAAPDDAAPSDDTMSGVVRATAAELLLWLYGRIPVDPGADPAVLRRFRDLCFTD